MGYEFGFIAGLFALPLAGLPILLHLLFRRKSPVVQFSTLRFIKSSLQHTAARRRVHRWLLLAVRALLIALLIWALSQPVLPPASAWTGSGRSTAAVIVLDTSYSMQLQVEQATLLARADGIVRELLNNQLHGAKVSILRSVPAPMDRPEAEELRRQETFRDSGDIHWATPLPTASPKPLIERVAAAVEKLQKRDAVDKWLIVISDFQKREFTRPIPELPGARIVLIDLHPDDTHTAGLTSVALNPPQPTPGANAAAVVEIAGRPSDARQLNVSTLALDTKAKQKALRCRRISIRRGMCAFLSPLHVPALGWVQINAALQLEEPLAWARSRSLLLQVPPVQHVTLIVSADMRPFVRPVLFGLDPGELTRALSVSRSSAVPADANVTVLMAGDWPDAGTAQKLLTFVRGGGTLIWFVRPGLEQSWAGLSKERKAALTELLPGVPVIDYRPSPQSAIAVVAPGDPVLNGLTDPRDQLDKVIVYRYLPFAGLDASVSTLLTVNPTSPGPGQRSHGLLFRKNVGSGTAFTIGTLPGREYTSWYLNPTFSPMLVQMSLRPPDRSDAQNVEIGQPLTWTGGKGDSSDLRIVGPAGDVSVAKGVETTPGSGRFGFHFDRTDSPGLYAWHRPDNDALVAMGNVQPPGYEAELVYTQAARLVQPGSDAVVARSSQELAARFETLRRPQPKWTRPIGLVMLLMCAEALTGSASGQWKGLSWRGLVARKTAVQV